MVSKDHALACTRQYLDQLNTIPADAKSQIMEDLTLGKIQLRQSQLCRLWAGMGSIYKVSMDTTIGKSTTTTNSIPCSLEFVIKHVTPPPRSQQSFGDRRKAVSYQVEANFYQHVAKELLKKMEEKDEDSEDGSSLILPTPYSVEYGPKQDEITIAMSYLDGSSIDTSRRDQVQATLTWLAHFHAAYWGKDTISSLVSNVGLQPIGSYWHLETRPDEHASLSNQGWQGRLKRAAQAIHDCLQRDPMQCLIHGDPKDANIMKVSSKNNNGTHNNNKRVRIAMYDFQYCGQGTPTRDLAYFLCTSCDPDDETEWIHYYHEQLCQQLLFKQKNEGISNPPPTLQHVEQSMLLAFADFYRFLCGWGQWGYNVKPKVLALLDSLDHGRDLGSEQAYHEAIQNEFW